MSTHVEEGNVIDVSDRLLAKPGARKRRPWQRFATGEDMESGNIVDALPALDKKQEREWTIEDVRALYCPGMKLLPFVVMKEEGANPCDNAVNYWCDEPTKHGHVDYKRGRVYVQLLLKAIEADRPSRRRVYGAPRYLEQIFEAMIEDAINRRRKGGKGSRTNISSTMSGFFRELAHHICGLKDPLGPAA